MTNASRLADIARLISADPAVTNSRLDTTEGRLVKVGDYGLGGNGPTPPSGDCNLAVVPATYAVGGSNINTPFGSGPSGSILTVQRFSSTSIIQTFLSYDGRVDGFTRRLNNGVWSEWNPMGIHRGSNANGEFVRFADGTQICTRLVRVTGSYGILVSANAPATFLAGTMRGGGCISETGIVGLTAAQLRDISASLSVQCNVEFGTRWRLAIASSVTVPDGAEFDVLLTANGRWR